LLAAIDIKRGALTRSVWCLAAFTAALAAPDDAPGPFGLRITVDPRMPPGTIALAGPGHDGKPQVIPFRLGPLPPDDRPWASPDADVTGDLRAAHAKAAADWGMAEDGCPHRIPAGSWCKVCKLIKT
jgi:hypothetical protein